MNNTTAGEQRPKKHFWSRFLRLSRAKSHSKQENESNECAPNSDSDGCQFSTIDYNSLSEVHRDAGILFLNKTCGGNNMFVKEENKHVQFAPTPLNKYYKVDVKAAPSKRINSKENKENVNLEPESKPRRPILRVDKNRPSELKENSQSSTETISVKATYVEGPQVKTPLIQRTSTKIALLDRKNGSLPQLNVSNITKYGSLPRSSKLGVESYDVAQNECLVTNKQETLSICSQPFATNSKRAEWQRRSLRNVYRQSCYGISDPSRIIEQSEHLLPNTHSHRFSLGGQLIPPSDKTINGRAFDSSSQPSLNSRLRCPVQTYSASFQPNQNTHQLSHATHLTKSTISEPSRIPFGCSQQSLSNRTPYPANIEKQKTHQIIRFSRPAKSTISEPSNIPSKLLQHRELDASSIPNKALNEVGLPNAISTDEGSIKNTSSKSQISPHYIHLCETVSDKSREKCIRNHPYAQRDITTKAQKCSNVQKEYVPRNDLINANSNRQNSKVSTSEQCVSSGLFMNKTRKQAVKLSMYSQKRQLSNKICKYKSKENDEGFSSMADDECSFNCSCSTCMARNSYNNKKNSMVRKFFSNNKENRYFFSAKMRENKDMNKEMETIHEHTLESDGTFQQKTPWYECNDLLCQTPLKPIKVRKDDPNEPYEEKLFENIYENLTHIINSATKKTYKTEDVKRMFSTPISSPLKTPKKISHIDDDKQLQFKETLSEEDCKSSPLPIKPLFFNDSVVLLQEIFQKLSQECKELLQPDYCTDSPGSKVQDMSISSKCVKDLVKNLQSKELSEEDFANMIGNMAQNIFLETKAKRCLGQLVRSKSFSDLRKTVLLKSSRAYGSLEYINSAVNNSQDAKHFREDKEKLDEIFNKRDSCKMQNKIVGRCLFSESDPSLQLSPGRVDSNLDRTLPDGWSRTPSTSKSEDSETDLQMLENVIRLGMGLNPISKEPPLFYTASPKKVTKYKSRDVLSGKGKLKLKLYFNSGLVTVHVMRATKLNWSANKELNSYVKVCLVPDESKRVHWRTGVQKAEKNPRYDHKFSFEVLEGDSSKRLLFSLWHRDYEKQRSELIGCMSFSLKHVMDPAHKVDGWYRLLREGFGVQKHFAARAKAQQVIKSSS